MLLQLELFNSSFYVFFLSLCLYSLKREIRKLAQDECGYEEPTVAMAFVYFEKLVLQGKLNKQNRKLCAGACVLLAAKIGGDLKKHEVKLLIDVSCLLKIKSSFQHNKSTTTEEMQGSVVDLCHSQHPKKRACTVMFFFRFSVTSPNMLTAARALSFDTHVTTSMGWEPQEVRKQKTFYQDSVRLVKEMNAPDADVQF